MPAVQILLRQQCRAVANPWKSARNARRIPNPGNVGELAPQDNQLMPKHPFSASSRNFDLNGEVRTARTKQSSPIIPPV